MVSSFTRITLNRRRYLKKIEPRLIINTHTRNLLLFFMCYFLDTYVHTHSFLPYRRDSPDSNGWWWGSGMYVRHSRNSNSLMQLMCSSEAFRGSFTCARFAWCHREAAHSQLYSRMSEGRLGPCHHLRYDSLAKTGALPCSKLSDKPESAPQPIWISFWIQLFNFYGSTLPILP